MQVETTFFVSGTTKPFKDSLKALGGTWVASLQGWVFPENQRDTVEAFLENPFTELPKKGIQLRDYSEKSIIVEGDSKPFVDEFKSIGGKWNPSLRGWIFSKKKKPQVRVILEIDSDPE